MPVLTLPSHPASLRPRFAETGYLPLPGLLTQPGLQSLRQEVGRLEASATRRDLSMECMDDSPRHMTTLGGHHIARESPLISALYRDTGLLALLTALHGTDVRPVEEPVERHVLNILHNPGDTHGAHTDDYPRPWSSSSKHHPRPPTADSSSSTPATEASPPWTSPGPGRPTITRGTPTCCAAT